MISVQAVTAAGSTQADAAAITTRAPVLATATGDGTVGIKLPSAASGKLVIVKNLGASALKVYPATSDAINALSANASISLAAYTSAWFIGASASTWYTVPLLPS